MSSLQAAQTNANHSLDSLEQQQLPSSANGLDEATAKNSHDFTSGDDKEEPKSDDIEKAAAPVSAAAAAPAVPDGGLTAWLTVAGCFLAFFATFGLVTGFGVFQAYYEEALPNSSADDISWIGSFQLWAVLGMAVPSVILTAHFGPHVALSLATFFTVFGIMMASISTDYYQILLSQGICTGIGVGLSFMPIIGLPNQWFSTRRGLAVGIAVSGASVGGVVWPILIDQMLHHDNVGYPWTMRTIGFLQLFLMATAVSLIRSNVPRNKAVTLRVFPFISAFRQPGVALQGVALLLHYFGIYIPYFYAPRYALALGASDSTAFYVSSALSAATFFGRFGMGAVSDRFGHVNTLVLTVVVSAVLAFAWQGVSSVAGTFVWVVFYGFFSGPSTSLQSPATIALVPQPKLRLMVPYIAILSQVGSFGSLGGGPIAGALLRDRTLARGAGGLVPVVLARDFYPMMWFTGAMLFGAVAFYWGARASHTRKVFAKV